MRPAGRSANQVRPVTLTRNYTKHAEGSVLVEFGDTKVLCTASIDEGVPRFLKGQGQGWITAEYGMLPRSTHTRNAREAAKGKQGGRTMEIQRLIARALRAAVDLKALGEFTITLDCDVLQADGGTLFLDEIGEMPLSLQAKLLRALQQGEVQRVGSDSPITVDVRVIAATNRNLREEVEQKRFREDLFFRLNVISIEVPALRERSEDIPLLAAHFLEKFAARNRKNVKGFAPQALDMLRRYSWPGNVRELQNAVERAVILCTGDLITGPELPASVTGAAEQAAPVPETAEASLAGLSLEALERRAIEDTLRQTEDNKSEAARRLGITRATLHNKLRKYGLE